MNLDPKHVNPHDDPSLHEVQPQPPTIDHREPFNDVVKHGDIVVGHQQNRVLSDYPKRVRPAIRAWSIVALALVLATIVYNLVVMF
ncbi:hypothetical protein [Alicyclobacillus fastidiosus]|uniref:Uncharacterized protein n=1 Tax=Alicyclobacillus fastidiosus TaxID=392011 RepID=A0ABV5AK84_9BACL|nr:hypothetical protein [Alicyclobacillus fastidiosus]WEH08264.1 hypothetical protein PYS47_16375 [Alicyclobacillus fastidiosus]